MKLLLLIPTLFICFSCQSEKEVCCGATAIMKPLPIDVRSQNPDGSWGNESNKRVYTSLMLIKLLHEGKTPKSEIYGKSIIRAMKYLTFIEAQKIIDDKGNDSEAYLVLEALQLSNKTVEAEDLTKARLKLEKILKIKD